jgi:hypothetical protein
LKNTAATRIRVVRWSSTHSANEVRITAQLVRTESGFRIWSETWNRSLDDTFAVQADIAAEVARHLKLKLLAAAPDVEETTPEAYTLYLQAQHLGRQGTAEGYVQSIEIVKQAQALDPNYAPCWNVLATNYLNE